MASTTTAGTLALKGSSTHRFAVIEGGAGKPHASSYPSIEEQLLFDDFSYNSDELACACSGLKVKLVYAASLLLMVGGLALATLL